ncbi:hypothetical protein LOD99_5830 [Oopsacas minuta]|uniref:Uncharacterized protein n=1 Tax=Oopsacas minuta TaxID=111878 RepID=A0AAV7JNV8_9METZ|nr:hypothetical protein LOD99_5830 [Oopsacas minuta]
MEYIDYDPLNPSSRTIFCTISLRNLQSIGAAGELIDSFDIIFDNIEHSYSLPFDDTALEIDKIVTVTQPISLDVKRIDFDRWEIYVESVYPQSSGEYTCNIGGCNTTRNIVIEYIPKVLDAIFSITLPPNSIDLNIKCPIEKSRYYLCICNTNSVCIENIPRVSFETPDIDLYFAPPLTTNGLVANTQEKFQCQIVPVSGSFFRESEYIISTTGTVFQHKNISKNVGESLSLAEYCQEFVLTIIFPPPSIFEMVFYNSNDQSIFPMINKLTINNSGSFFCAIQHGYFRASMLILNLTVIQVEITQTSPAIYPNTTVSSSQTPIKTIATPSIITNVLTAFPILEFPNYLYFLVFPGSGVIMTILIICLCVCGCGICYRKCCSGRSRKFSAPHEISPPIPPRRENFRSQPYQPLPELMQIALPQRQEFAFQRRSIGSPFEGGFEESVLSEIPMLRPHKDQTLYTEVQAKQQANDAKSLYCQSVSMPVIEVTPETVKAPTPKHNSTNTAYDISSTHPPSKSVSIDNLIPVQQPMVSQLLQPPVAHTRERSHSADASIQYSYGVLPSPALSSAYAPPQPLQTHPIAYLPVTNVSPSYIPVHQPIAFVQTPSVSPTIQCFPEQFNFSPPSPVVYPAFSYGPQITQQQPATLSVPPSPFLQSTPSTPIQAPLTPSNPCVDETPNTPATTININIISSKSLEKLPPGHFVDFL